MKALRDRRRGVLAEEAGRLAGFCFRLRAAPQRMDAGVRMPLRTVRGWLLYCCAWLPYAASYFLIFRLEGSRGWAAAVSALLNVVPAALLGVGVFWLAGRVRWPSRRPVLFAAWHVLGSVGYAVGWWACVQTLMSVWRWTAGRGWSFQYWGMYAAQWQAFSGLMVYGTLIGFAYMVQAQERARLEEKRRAEAESLRVRAELSALRSQLNPHFLFNTLNSVIALVGTDPGKAEQALLSLSAMLRYALGAHADVQLDEVSFAEELRFTQAYLALEQLRLGERLQVRTSIAEGTTGLALPSLTLQPLVENAVKHSIARRAEGGVLEIRAFADEGALVIEVWDDGRGALGGAVESGPGLGLKTVRRRLDLYYRQTATMTVTHTLESGFVVALRLPQDDAGAGAAVVAV